jgi:hypothetical protein
MPKPVVELVANTTADLRAGRESWRVIAFFSSCSLAITLLVQQLV